MKVGIIGAGNIAEKMSEVLNKQTGVEPYAIASRDLNKAERFARKWNFEKFYGSYEELVKDDKVELIYVATPHSHHYEHVKLCLENMKPVLCEKAFTVNAAQARELVELSHKNNVLLAEAIWTRYMPSRRMIDEIIQSGEIGKVTSLQANLGYILDNVERNRKPELAGGALLDLGVYTINFASMVFGNDIKSITAVCTKLETGVDAQESIALEYEDGKMAFLYTTMLSRTNREGIVNGDNGYLVAQNINDVEEIRVYGLDYQLRKTYQIPPQINGFEYEVLACKDALEKGRIECPEMPHDEIIRMMEIMDEIRCRFGVVYPNENVL